MAHKSGRLDASFPGESPASPAQAPGRARKAHGNGFSGRKRDEPDRMMDHYRLAGVLWKTPQDDRMRAILRFIGETERFDSVELWEAKGETGFRIEDRWGGKPISTVAKKREFLHCARDLRAQEVMRGKVLVSNGTKVVEFNSEPGDFAIKKRYEGVSFGNGCWIPVYEYDDERIRVTHMLAVHGHVSQLGGPGNEQLNSLITYARRDILGEINAQKKEEHGRRDRLTGLWNRGELDRVLLEDAADSILFHESSSLLLLDLDRFKRVNDLYGHPNGDRVLKLVASSISLPGVFAARYGGEEFVLKVPGSSQQDLDAIIKKIHGIFSHLACEIHGKIIPVRASIGVVSSSIWRALENAVNFPVFPREVKDRKEKQSLIENICRRIQKIKMEREKKDVDSEIKRLRGMGREAKWASPKEFKKSLEEGMPLYRYAAEWRDLLVILADTGMIWVKNVPRGRNRKTRDGIARVVVEDNTLKFPIVDVSKIPDPSES